MFQHRRLSLAGLILLISLSSLVAQTKEATQGEVKQQKSKTSTSKDQSLKGTKVAEADPAAIERRNTAISLLTSLADDARSFKDEKIRARVLAQTADALWTTDQERARDLFHRAWDAAEIGDAEAARLAKEEQRREQEQGRQVRRSRREMRSEILRMVAKRDRKLTDELLAKLEVAADREAKEAAADAKRQPMDQWSASAAQAKRLALASAMIEDGDVDRAIQVAAPVLQQVNKDSIFFLTELRTKNPAAADAAFANLLARAGADAASDANTVAGLSSYAFTPLLYITFAANGGSYASQQGPPSAPADLAPALRQAFFNTATGILTRPLLPPDQDTTTAG
ncbi:MAG: hypothetical protein ACJ8LM_16825, partial [Candidatus Udaeobacter sp.]